MVLRKGTAVVGWKKWRSEFALEPAPHALPMKHGSARGTSLRSPLDYARAPMTTSRCARLATFAPLVSLAAFAVACAPTPPPAAQTPVPPPPTVAPAPPPPDLSATPEPDGLMVFVRVSRPSAALKVIGGWTGMPMPGSEEAGALVAGESIGNVIDLDQPIDFALALKGRGMAGAISAAVHSMDDAKAAFSKYKLVAAENGALRVDGLGKVAGDDKDPDGGEARVCELVPSFGPATTRLVCAESEETIHALAPWLARSAPRLTYPSDVHLDVRFAPVRPTVDAMRRTLPILAGAALGMRRTGMPELDEAFRAGIDDLADFTSDCDTVAFDGMLGEPQGTITLTSQFRSTTSLLARLAVAHPERADVPPATFWKLPADSDAAFFHGGIDATDFEHTRDHVAGILGAALTKEGLGDADSKSIHDAATHALDLLTIKSTYAKGVDADAARKALAALKSVKEGDDAAREEAERVAAEKMAGWMIVGLDAPAAKIIATEKEWAAAWARPGVAKWVKTKITDSTAPTIKMSPAPKGLGVKDAAQLEIAVYRPHARPTDAKKKAPAPGKPLVLHAIVVPDGAASWMVFAADPDLAVAKVKEVLAGGSQLASRPGLASMKDARVTSGGFVSALGIADDDPFAWTLATKWHMLSRDVIGALASSADKGMTPVPFQATAQPAGSSAPSGTFVSMITVPKGAIESFVRMAFLRR